ncbi:MAG: Polyribonucleotide 5'-hydroxyl-kinase [Candidatus Bathyarchaeota archaeon BA2]|nr:MAG: Polyribonucleotide 5'-hydroxyl-kinase [Candidatus Bathyarchaeota archaeon BA2]
MKKAKVQSFSLNWIKVEGAPIGTGKPLTAGQMKEIRNLLGTTPIYSEETPATVFIVLRKNWAVNEDQIERIKESFSKKVKLIKEGEEEGLLAGLHDGQGKFLGIGILCGVDYKRRVMKIYTPMSKNVSTIRFGQIKLDENGREIGLSTVYADYIP